MENKYPPITETQKRNLIMRSLLFLFSAIVFGIGAIIIAVTMLNDYYKKENLSVYEVIVLAILLFCMIASGSKMQSLQHKAKSSKTI